MRIAIAAEVDFAAPEYPRKTDPLLWGGTPVDDAVMDLVRLAEVAVDDPRTKRELDEIVELISATLSQAIERQPATGSPLP